MKISRRYMVWLFGLTFGALGFSLARSAELFPAGSQWKYLKGRSEASPADPSAWTALSFDDANWTIGPAPLFYGEPLNGTELADMRGNYTSVFLRKKFVATNPAEMPELHLNAVSDDGFIAWINGREVVRYNVPAGTLAFNATASGAVAEPVPVETYLIANPREFLVAGENVLAVHAFNVSLGDSSDFVFDASLSAVVDVEPPVVEQVIPVPGSSLRELFAIEVAFSEPVQGVDAADLLVNGNAATNVTEIAAGQFVFSFPQPPDGMVSIAWRAAHGIADRGSIHPFAGGSWFYLLDTRSPAPGVMISEFMADNNKTLNDEDGNSSDWIEIFNSGSSAANLAGWFLTDDASNLTKWRFPNVSLIENGYLIVFASEKNKTNATGRLHTNFKLSNNGEYLALVSPATNIISEFRPAYPSQFTDVSYGRVPGEPQTTGYFTRPTPGLPNAASGPGFASEVSFSRTSASFTSPFSLTLSTPSSNAIIRYTVDGTLPTNSSRVYAASIPITNSVQVRARAFQTGLLPGPPHSESYLLLSNNIAGFNSDLPVVVLHTLGAGSPSSSRQTFAHLEVYEPVNGVTSFMDAPTLTTRSALKVRGSSTEGLPKASFALEFWDEFNQDVDKEILGLPADSDWVLYAPNQFEPVLIHNPFIHQLSRDMGQYSPRTRFVEVYLNKTSGPISEASYNGIYVLEEKIKIGKHRVDIDKLEPEHVLEPEVTGGYMLKIDRLDPGDSGFSAASQPMAYVDPKEREIKLPQRDPQEQYIKNYFTAFGKALNATNWLDPKLGYAAYVDVDQWIDFHVLEVLSGNVDAIVLSTYFYKPRSGKILFGPHWDFDRALGSTDGRDLNPRNWNAGPFFASWFNRVFRDLSAWQKWVDRYQDLRTSHFSRTNINALIDRLANEVRQAQPRERAKWRIALRGGSYQSEVNMMKNWLSNRMDYIDRQLTQPPRLSAAGSQVTPGFILNIAGPTNATVYYTLDGSDPRLPQGDLSPKAGVYTGPITLNANARVVARARDLTKRQTGGPPATTPWSGPAIATFTVASPPLVITELMFNPAPPPAGGANTEDNFEFIELKNVSPNPLNLVGYRFTNGVLFTFTETNGVTNLAPGGRVVLVKNRAAFAARYPGVTNVAGDYEHILSNDSDRLALVGPLLEPVLDFAYDAGWYPLADGPGFSIVLADENTSPNRLGEATSWRLSASAGGSPGLPDPAPPVLRRVFVNELLTHSTVSGEDTLELFNPDPAPVDISGWFVSDDFGTPKKYRVPQAIVRAQGYFVFKDRDFQTGAGTSFTFSKFGDEVYLFSADAAGNLTGWFHGFQFGVSESGVSFGRHLGTGGSERFVAQTRITLGAANAGPRVGPVVINEIMYEPPPNGGVNDSANEFIELLNTSAETVLLFDPAHPANTWQLRGAVDFDFPANTMLSANGRLVVVGFDPRNNLSALAGFRSRYGTDPETLILGPWSGSLNNAGEGVHLLKPDAPLLQPSAAAGTVPYVLVEQIVYSKLAPWPTNAAGAGQSLLRRDPGAFADDPANWTSGLPTPGDADTDGDGLPDRWEIANGLNPKSGVGDDGAGGDPDGDSFTNWQEFRSSTSPRNANSLLRVGVARGAVGSYRLTFPVVPGRVYTVQYRDDFALDSWRTLRTIIAPPEGAAASITDTLTNRSRFYRLQVP